jgi:hypothetical protein
MATFGDRYKKLIDSNPNKKSIPNNDPGIVQGVDNSKNPYKKLLASGSIKSEFNDDPGLVFVPLVTKNPYTELIKKWDFTRTNPTAPFIGRRHREELIDLFYVDSGYVDETPDRYVAIEKGKVVYPYYT